jgi:CarD family transcriptional regulator
VFSIQEKVVYPGHGVAQVSRIIEKKVCGNATSFFELKFLNKDMTILVPVHNAASAGIRPLSSDKNINDIFKLLSEPKVSTRHEPPSINWSKKNKGYQEKLRTGDLREICTIYRDLKYISLRKELSFGERNLLQTTEALLVEEISIVQNIAHDQAVQRVRSLCSLTP